MYKLYFFILCSVISLSNCSKIKVKEPTDDVWRPCAFNDLECLNKIFNEKNWCYGEREYPNKKGYWTDTNVVSVIPYFNLTATYDHTYGDLSKGRVVELFFNNKTGNSVFSIQFDNLKVTADVVLLYHRKLKEDIEIRTKITELYDSLITTTAVKKGNDPVTETETKAYISNLPQLDLGKGADKIKNEEVAGLFDAIYERPDVFLAELNQVRAVAYGFSYAENIICGYKPPKKC